MAEIDQKELAATLRSWVRDGEQKLAHINAEALVINREIKILKHLIEMTLRTPSYSNAIAEFNELRQEILEAAKEDK